MAPLRTSVPAPDFVKSAPLDPAMTPGYVNEIPVGTLMVPSFESSVIPRFALSETLAVTASVPPSRVTWSAVTLPGTAPRFLSVETDTVPAVTVVPAE